MNPLIKQSDLDNESRREETASNLAGYYAVHGSWDGVASLLRRGHGRGAGTGPPLRLTITRSLVEAHGGHLWAERVEEEESTFAFALPVLVEA